MMHKRRLLFYLYDHAAFRPWRLQALAFKAIRRLYPDYPLWGDFAHEYEHERLAIDLINGSPLLRTWVDDPESTPEQLDAPSAADEEAWQAATVEFLLYRCAADHHDCRSELLRRRRRY